MLVWLFAWLLHRVFRRKVASWQQMQDEARQLEAMQREQKEHEVLNAELRDLTRANKAVS